VNRAHYIHIHPAFPAALAMLLLVPALSSAEEDPAAGWFARAWGGYSNLSDTSGSISEFGGGTTTSTLDVSAGRGFTAGAGIGHRYNRRLAVELAWEYRSNDSETALADGPSFHDGNYASNTFFLNGYYHFGANGNWDPYLGAGLTWIQEVDIDLEGNGPELSYSGDGDVGLQLFIGSNYRLSESWTAHGELRYGSVTGIDLKSENVSGTISDFDYEPLTLQFGVSYRF
jgi:opacity protein-like surface antigen